jgi:hypothetical protein
MARKRKVQEDPIEISDESEDEEPVKKKRKTTTKAKKKSPPKKKSGGTTIEISDTDVYWEWQENYYSGFQRYESSVSEQIEKAFQINASGTVNIQINGNNYKLDLEDRTQENEKTHAVKSIKRTEIKTNVRRVEIDELNELFDKYKEIGKDEDAKVEGISGEGIEAFANDAGVDPMDVALLVMFWRLKCETQFFITKNEFVNGLARLGMETMDKIQTKLPKLAKTELKDEQNFTDFYNFCFTYSKEPTQRTLPLDTAIPTWKLILTKDRCDYINDWCDYMTEVNKKAVTQDTWSKTFIFFLTC